MEPTAGHLPTFPVLRAGLIGCGEIAQVVHIPTLSFLSELFRITYLCDVSNLALEHCKTKILGSSSARTTTDPAELCGSTDVDVVFVVNSDEYHAEHTILALKHNKFVFLEKPAALCMRDIERIIIAQNDSEGKVMVGYMRRYAPAFVDAVKKIGGIEKILYARIRDIIGPNSTFVGQSGTFPRKFSDYTKHDTEDLAQRATELVKQALEQECKIPVTKESTLLWRCLGGLGTHDLSAMREALGMPRKVIGVHQGFPFWSALFEYPGFAVTYESGLHSVPKFDAHIEIYGQDKIVKVQYDSPYVKGLPTTLHICENVDGSYHETMVRKTYQDNYTLELKALHDWVTKDISIKTTVEDAAKDMEIFQMILKAVPQEV